MTSSFVRRLPFIIVLGLLFAARVVGAQEASPSTDGVLPLRLGIDVHQTRWNTFQLDADTDGGDTTTVEWSFGDGTTEKGTSVTHAYRWPGRYVVSAVATTGDAVHAQQKVILVISFWHRDNWQLWTLLGVLAVFVVLLFLLARERRDQHTFSFPMDDDETSGDLPPVLRGLPNHADEEAPKRSARSRKRATTLRKPKTKSKRVKRAVESDERASSELPTPPSDADSGPSSAAPVI